MRKQASPAPRVRPNLAEVHLCDNYSHLLLAAADLASRAGDAGSPRPLVFFIDDRIPLGDDLLGSLSALTGAEIVRVSDDASIDDFARLPCFLPAMLRRNVSWSNGWKPVRPSAWTPPFLDSQRFGTGYVYHPGFFLSKVLAGRCDRIVMRDSGYANYVRHRVPWQRKPLRVVAGRSPTYQTWGEEPWVDEIQVVRPDQVPHHVRHKASRVTLADHMDRLSGERSRALARAFWDDTTPPPTGNAATALIVTQPIDQLGICSVEQKRDLYEGIADRLRQLGFGLVVKPHPREHTPALAGEPQIPAAFPIEAWAWLGPRPFDLAVSLNSTALSDVNVRYAKQRLQLIAPERFYRDDWPEWPKLIDQSFDGARLVASPTATTHVPPPGKARG